MSFWEVILGAFALIGLLGCLALLALWIFERFFDEEAESQFGFAPTPVDRGTPIIDYANGEALRGIAMTHKIETPPSRIERGRKRGLRGGTSTFGGKTESNETETIEQPEDLADLLYRLLRHLHKEGELNQTADCVQAELLEGPVPFFMDEDEATVFFRGWLEETYPEGIENLPADDLVKALASIGRKPPEARIRTLVTHAFDHLHNGEESILFLEGEWRIETDADETIRLSRNDLRVTMGNGAIGPQSLPMPRGISITALLPTKALTTHGRTRMLGVTLPIRACMIATPRQYNADAGCFELAPIAVFQRLG